MTISKQTFISCLMLGSLACLFGFGWTAERSATAGQKMFAESPKRLTFSRGSIVVRETGHLTRTHSHRYYVIRARQGQHMVLNLISQTRSGIVPLAIVTSPSGSGSLNDKGFPMHRAIVLPESGDYRFDVAPNLMASNGTSGDYLMEVVVY